MESKNAKAERQAAALERTVCLEGSHLKPWWVACEGWSKVDEIYPETSDSTSFII